MAHDSSVSPAQPTDAYTRAHDGAVPEAERRRLALQSDLFASLAAWSFDALGVGPGARVLEVGCGNGELLALAAERVGPTGRVVGIDRDAGLVAAARTRVTPYPWVEVVEAPLEHYNPGGAGFDAVHCRMVLMHQDDPEAFVARLVALVRPGGWVAVQDLDADGPTGAPCLTCHPPFPAFEDLMARIWAASDSDVHAGRKALDRFARAGLADLRVQASASYMPFTDPGMQATIARALRAGAGARLVAAGIMGAAEFAAAEAEIHRAHGDPAFASVLVRGRTFVATVGMKPA